MRKYSINLLLLSLSISISLIVGECILRALFNPVDYLRPSLVYDDQLGTVKVKSGSAGHDSWGYRNKVVPPRADIVAIGDSQTYGISATRNNSWPAQLQKKTGKTVYNLSLGAYNPVQYYFLLKDKALKLNPSLVIVGLYYGNDLIGAYRDVYQTDKWKFLRRPDLSLTSQMQSVEEEVVMNNHKFMGSLRQFLSQNSILYRMITFSFGDMFRFIEMEYIRKDKHKDITILKTMGTISGTGFTPKRRLMGLNINDARIREGLRVSLELLSRMNEICVQKEIIYLVVLIPTKEHVYSEYIEENGSLTNSDVIDELIRNEREVNRLVREYLEENNIAYVDVLEGLKRGIKKKAVYPSNEDGHPNKYGYEMIANEINKYLISQVL